MIEHVDLQDPGSFGQPASQPDISFARRRIARRVVVFCGARIYVQCAEEALVSEPFYQACLIHLLHITTALTARTGFRCCAAMMGCALLCWGAISHRLKRPAFHFQIDFDITVGCFDGSMTQPRAYHIEIDIGL